MARTVAVLAKSARWTLRPGEAAEFDTRVPRWFGSRGDGPAGVLSLFGPQGERAHLRAAPGTTKRD
jgi:hypothetical protein